MVLIDPPLEENETPAPPPPPEDVDPEVATMTWFVCRDIGWRGQWDLREFHDALLPLSPEARWELAAQRLLAAGCIPPQSTAKDLRWVFESKQANQQVTMRVLLSLEPRRYSGRVTLLFSEHSREDTTEDAIHEAFSRLRRHLVGPVDLHFISGDHGNLFLAPQVNELMGHMNRCMSEGLRS